MEYMQAKLDEMTVKKQKLNEEIEDEKLTDKLAVDVMILSVCNASGEANVQNKSRKCKKEDTKKADNQAKIIKVFKLNK